MFARLPQLNPRRSVVARSERAPTAPQPATAAAALLLLLLGTRVRGTRLAARVTSELWAENIRHKLRRKRQANTKTKNKENKHTKGEYPKKRSRAAAQNTRLTRFTVKNAAPLNVRAARGRRKKKKKKKTMSKKYKASDCLRPEDIIFLLCENTATEQRPPKRVAPLNEKERKKNNILATTAGREEGRTQHQFLPWTLLLAACTHCLNRELPVEKVWVESLCSRRTVERRQT